MESSLIDSFLKFQSPGFNNDRLSTENELLDAVFSFEFKRKWYSNEVLGLNSNKMYWILI